MAFPPDLDESQQLPSGTKEIDFHTKHPLFQDLCPEDSYTEDGTYWVSHSFAVCQMCTRRRTRSSERRTRKSPGSSGSGG